MPAILIVDDEGKMRALLAMALDAEGYSVDEAESAEKALTRIDTSAPDVIITDVRMPGMSGLDLVKAVKHRRPRTEVIVMTAYADAKSGIEAMRNGAFEYVAKPFEMDEMLLVVKSALDKGKLADEVKRLREEVQGRHALSGITSRSKGMTDAVALARMVAPRDTTVLIRGSSGTGKELIARGIHDASGRASFVAVNCGALTETLLASELFGHEKGSFTGATERKVGLFERAGDGTVFLDEIGDITPGLQVKLLRVLQEREFTRVGGAETLRTRARVIAATNRDLEAAVKVGEFREDLYYRLNVFPITVPSLAARTEDVSPLVDVFLLKFKHTPGIDADALARLEAYSWPGNVRELENAVERAVIMAGSGQILLQHLPPHVRDNRVPGASRAFTLPPEGVSLDEVEKNLVVQALDMAHGNKTNAARLLGISRRALYSKMSTHEIVSAGKEEGEEAE